MSKKANPAAVGGFVLGAIALAVGGILLFGGTTLFAPTADFVVFFDGSVNGLQIGAPVKMEGVEIGKVTQIQAIVDAVETRFFTETRFTIDRRQFIVRGRNPDLRPEQIKALIDHGLRARLELQSFITGQLYISVAFYPGSDLRLVGGAGHDVIEVPAVPSTSQEVIQKVREVVASLRELPVDDIVKRINSTLEGLDRLVNDPEFRQLSANANGMFAEARGVVADARRLVANVDDRMGPLADSAVDAMDQGRETLQNVNDLLKPGSPTVYQTSLTLQEVAEAARAIRLLATFVEQNPNSVVFGRSASGN